MTTLYYDQDSSKHVAALLSPVFQQQKELEGTHLEGAFIQHVYNHADHNGTVSPEFLKTPVPYSIYARHELVLSIISAFQRALNKASSASLNTKSVNGPTALERTSVRQLKEDQTQKRYLDIVAKSNLAKILTHYQALTQWGEVLSLQKEILQTDTPTTNFSQEDIDYAITRVDDLCNAVNNTLIHQIQKGLQIITKDEKADTKSITLQPDIDYTLPKP